MSNKTLISTSTVTIHSDGGSRGNPGPAAIGAVVEIGGAGGSDGASKSCGASKSHSADGKTYEISEPIGRATNNTAEYKAVIAGLNKAKQVLGKSKAKKTRVKCYLDSELVVKQLNREYRIKEPSLQGPFVELWNLTFEFGKVEFNHVRRERNKKADELVNKALG